MTRPTSECDALECPVLRSVACRTTPNLLKCDATEPCAVPWGMPRMATVWWGDVAEAAEPCVSRGRGRGPPACVEQVRWWCG